MNDVKEVGIIGQLYEDRKSGKKGVLESRDERFKTLVLAGEDGKSFSINYSTFRSNWRKVHTEDEKPLTAYDSDDLEEAVESHSEVMFEPSESEFELSEQMLEPSEEVVAEVLSKMESDGTDYSKMLIKGCENLRDSHLVLEYYNWRRKNIPNAVDMKVEFANGAKLVI